MNDVAEASGAVSASLFAYSEHPFQGVLQNSLSQLIVPNWRHAGWHTVVASADTGNPHNSHYATPFMRDTAFFILGLLDAMDHGDTSHEANLKKAITSLHEIDRYQALKDNPLTGVRAGMLPHELRFPFINGNPDNPCTHYARLVRDNWQVYNPGQKNEYLASYDTAEGTHLYVLSLMRIEQRYPGFIAEHGKTEILRRACDYILNNSIEHNRLAGFTNTLPWSYLKTQQAAFGGITESEIAHLPNAARKIWGAEFQTIRDQGDQCFPNGLKPMPGHPISDLETTAIKYVALKMAADYFEHHPDPFYARYSARFSKDAALTKTVFNSQDSGFLRRDTQGLLGAGEGHHYFVEARGVNPATRRNEQLPYHSPIALYALAHPYIGPDKKPDYVIADEHIHPVARQIANLFEPGFGLPTYSPKQIIPQPINVPATNYWWSSGTTCWGIEQFKAANALSRLGYVNEALAIASNAADKMHAHGSSYENWIKDNGRVVPWYHPTTKQQAGHDMAFVVGPALEFQAWVMGHIQAHNLNRNNSPVRGDLRTPPAQMNYAAK